MKQIGGTDPRATFQRPRLRDPRRMPVTVQGARILIIDDDPDICQLLTLALRVQGYETETALTGHQGLEKARAASFDLALLDIILPDLVGVELLSPLRAMHPDIAVVMITAQATTETAVRALNEGARAYIIKPFSVTATMSTVREILQEQRCSREQRVKLEQLRQYATELEAQNEELDAFAHTVAHDLKAFSYRISGYAEALLHDEHDPLPQNVQQQCLRIMAQGARRMSTLIDELLLFAQVSGEEVDVRPLAMGEIVARAQRRLGFLIEDRQAELIVRGDWPTALGHAPWVEEIWVNYISNAVKYGGRPREGIPPRVELGHDGPTHQRGDQSETSRPGTGSHIRLWIRDNGPGLTPEEQAHVFTPFTRQRQLETTGHGLGLSIVQRIVNKLGGEVGVESQAGRGSTFSFTLPRDHGWKPRSCSEERGAQ